MIIFYYLAPICVISWFFLDWYDFLIILAATWLAFYLNWCTGGIKSITRHQANTIAWKLANILK